MLRVSEGQKVMGLESDETPSKRSKNDEKLETQIDNGLYCSREYAFVFCHLEMLRHSLSEEIHLTQVGY